MCLNVILIFVDDMGYGDFGVFGNLYVWILVLDFLFNEGVALM